MNTIDLSKAKVGDKFRARNGEVVTYTGIDGRIAKSRSDYYICVCSNDAKVTYFKNGALLLLEEHPYDLVEQVFDKPLDELIEEATKQFKENNDAIAEENELQRRQEVVELAEKLFTRGTMKDWFHELCLNNKLNATYVEYIFAYAEEFVGKREKYLKDGKYVNH